MPRLLYSGTGLGLLAVAFLVFTLFNNLLFSGVRLDLTENGLFTLSDGSKEIVGQLDEPIDLYFFFSDKSSENLAALRVYAKRVEQLLNEYESHSDGKIRLSVIDPEPFSEDEDRAAEFGLQSVPIDTAGQELYFGLAATNALDDKEIIAFFQPDKEEFLEYEISKLIHSLSETAKPAVGFMSTLKMQGDVNMQTFQQTPGWIVYTQLEQLFDLRTVPVTAETIDGDLAALVIVHPKGMSETTEYAIDQFALGGGRVMLFVDPLAEMDQPPQPQNPMMPSAPQARSSDAKRLLNAWGLNLRENEILGDSQTALTVGGPNGQPIRHFAILGMEADNLADGDVVTDSLETVNLASSGILERTDGHTTTITPLVSSSPYSMPLDALQFQFLTDPKTLQTNFKPDGTEYMVAARVAGKATSAFADSKTDEAGHIGDTDSLNVIVFADTDLLADRLWVRVQSFFGQSIASPFANNGDLVVNALDNLVGSSSLISIRSRGRFTRPFDVVQDLRREADASYLAKANELQARLADTERQLSELQSSRKEQNVLRLTPEQETALARFQDEKMLIRKELREVRHQLDVDIERLGSTLKFLNVAFIPIVLTLLLVAWSYLRLAGKKEAV